MKNLFAALLFIFSLTVALTSAPRCFAAEGAPAGTVELNNQGIELLKKENFSAAQDKFAQGLADSPYSSELQVNLGLAFSGAGNKEKAMQAYELSARTAKSKETRFAANFNLGELFGKDKKVDEALKYYQLALADKPDSVETKTNIELLIQNNQGGGKGESKDDKKDNKDKNKDQNKDKNKQDGSKDKDKDKDKENKDQNDKNQKNDQKKEGYQKDKPQPRQFKSDQLSPGDVKKILEELNRQEQRVRAEYNKKQVKERPRDKDW
jgi:Ca-activated chloride channel family protein